MHFLHVRKTDANGEIITKGGKTFAFEVSEPLPVNGRDGVRALYKVTFAEARCHGDKQNFDRKIGRMVAEGRFHKGNTSYVYVPDTRGEVTAVSLFNHIRAHLANL